MVRSEEQNSLRAKLGIFAPMYNGWIRGIDEGENDPTFKYAAETAIRAEEIGIHSIWVPDDLLNPMKGEREKSLEAWTTLTALAVMKREPDVPSKSGEYLRTRQKFCPGPLLPVGTFTQQFSLGPIRGLMRPPRTAIQ